MSDVDNIPITLRLSPDSCDNAARLYKWLDMQDKAVNRADAVAWALELAVSIMDKINEGSTIECRSSNGEISQLVIE